MVQLYPFQERGLTAWEQSPHRRNLLVAPTGAGKSVMFSEVVRRLVTVRNERVVFTAHSIELLTQARGHFQRVGVPSGIIAPGFDREPYLPVQCASLDTLSARNERPPGEWMINDEAHHSVAPTWWAVLNDYPNLVGFTATPERRDRKPLGDLFDHLITVADYSELLAVGQLVPCKVINAGTVLTGSDLAADPVESYLAHGEAAQAFCFCRSVAHSKEVAERFRQAGVRAENIDGKMADDRRAEILSAFRAGDLDVLTNVYILTEGVDVPQAAVCILAAAPGSISGYLQRVGRVLRKFAGKTYAILIDLVGVSMPDVFGQPTLDRTYSLNGRAITAKGDSLKHCPRCFLTLPANVRRCPNERCLHTFEIKPWTGPTIVGLELREMIYNLGETKHATREMRHTEWKSLVRKHCGVTGLYQAVKEYREIFGDDPPIKKLPESYRLKELRWLYSVYQDLNSKRTIIGKHDIPIGWVNEQYRAIFGGYASRNLRRAAGIPLPFSFRDLASTTP